jgi:hypothetical protein
VGEQLANRPVSEPRGATPQEWGHLDWTLGLSANLLPCIPAGPDVKCVAGSSLEGKVGKIPSAFNAQGLAHGITDWTKRPILGNEIALWSKDGRYNVCIRTGQISSVHAFDIDIDDSVKAAEVAQLIEQTLGMKLPRRERENSGKFLLMFRLAE